MTSERREITGQEGSVSRAPGRGSRWPLPGPNPAQISAPEISGPPPTREVTPRDVLRSLAWRAVRVAAPWVAAWGLAALTHPLFGVALLAVWFGVTGYLRYGHLRRAPGAAVEPRGDRSPRRAP